MAQVVGYFENNVTYTEGPFVVVNATGFRIEVELKGHVCPVLPDYSIYDLLKSNGFTYHKSNNKEEIASLVDWLNQQVKNGVIHLSDKGIWVA